MRSHHVLVSAVFALSFASAGAAQAGPEGTDQTSALQTAARLAHQAQGPSGVHSPRRAIDLQGGTVRYVVGPTSAADCPVGRLCLYDAPYYSGNMLDLTGSGRSFNLADFGFADLASSWINARPRSSYLHDPPSLGPPEICVPPGGSSPSAGDWNNRINVAYLAAAAARC